MTEASSGLAPRPRRSARRLWIPLAAGVVVAVAIGVIARQEAIAPGTYPGGYFRLFFSDPLHLKVWFATAAMGLAVFQPIGAAWMFGKLPLPRPSWIAAAHRWNGRLVILLTLPVAYHCIFKIGFLTTTDRVIAHALLGCAVYGLFVAKVIIVRMRRLPTAALVTTGSLLFCVLLATWVESALFFFRTAGVHL
jgi:hypothetical protein